MSGLLDSTNVGVFFVTNAPLSHRILLTGAYELAHQVEGLAAKPDDLSLIPGTPVKLGGQSQVHRDVLRLPHTWWTSYTHVLLKL